MISYRANLSGLPAPARAIVPPPVQKRGNGPRGKPRPWEEWELALIRAAISSGAQWASYGPALMARTGRTSGSIAGKFASLKAAAGRL